MASLRNGQAVIPPCQPPLPMSAPDAPLMRCCHCVVQAALPRMQVQLSKQWAMFVPSVSSATASSLVSLTTSQRDVCQSTSCNLRHGVHASNPRNSGDGCSMPLIPRCITEQRSLTSSLPRDAVTGRWARALPRARVQISASCAHQHTAPASWERCVGIWLPTCFSHRQVCGEQLSGLPDAGVDKPKGVRQRWRQF
jgi:hypothetical protein